MNTQDCPLHDGEEGREPLDRQLSGRPFGRFELHYGGDVPAAYIDLVEGRKEADSKQQIVVGIDALKFTPQELIFDVDGDGRVIGVEIL